MVAVVFILRFWRKKAIAILMMKTSHSLMAVKIYLITIIPSIQEVWRADIGELVELRR